MAAVDKSITTTHILVPIAVMAVTLLLLFAFQMTQIMRDRTNLQQAMAQQQRQVEDAQKLNTQFGGLVVGTRKLAEEGDKNAQLLIEQLKKIGVIPSERPGLPPAQVPAAMGKAPPAGPVKP